MGSRPPGPWGLCILYGLQDQKEFSNDFWFKLDGTPSFDWDQAAAASAIVTALELALVPVMSLNAKWKGGSFLYNDGTGTKGAEYYLNNPGLLSGNAAPEDVAVVVRKNTVTFTPGSEGRWYFTGLAISNVQGSYLTSGAQTDWQTAVSNLIADIPDQGVTWQHAHYHKKVNTLLRVPHATPVALLGTRRRRRFRF